MADLSTKYMGISLKNPIIVGASALTANLDSILHLEKAGAAALVTKSLFEEEIQLENFVFDEDLGKGNYRYAEMITLRPNLKFAGPAEHLMWVGMAKEAIHIPVIASLNAVNQATWFEYAKRLEAVGVDALECNFFASPGEIQRKGADIEKEQIELVRKLKKAVSIPVGVKLSSCYSNVSNVVRHMDQAGADGFVLFNRFVEPDIDVATETHLHPFNFSHDTDYRLPLRYAGLLEGAIQADICCSSGIFQGEDVIKMLLAGAASVQTVSAIFTLGYGHIRKMLADIQDWMDRKGYKHISDFRGKLSMRRSGAPGAYLHAHYAKLVMNSDIMMNDFSG
ncbi:MAG: dihydroorotate dehydrogenase-like protein [Kiritimatiellae bacterium]|nr:dihydroorotate dehydrogenase-like protein [Kiritimatiellia bacterium]